MDGQKSRRDTSGYLRERTGCILSYEHAVVEIEESEKEPYRNRGARESGPTPSQAAKSTGPRTASDRGTEEQRLFASIRDSECVYVGTRIFLDVTHMLWRVAATLYGYAACGPGLALNFSSAVNDSIETRRRIYRPPSTLPGAP